MNEKKVILFIVEGPSDRAALGPIMEEYFNSEDIKFLIVHGDITIKNYITKDNAIIKVNEQIKEKLKELNEYSYAAEPPVQFRLSHLSRRSEPL